MKWGSRYSADYVNILRAMVGRNLEVPHHFHCFTDDASGIDRRVEVNPLPEMDLPDGIPERCWRKLSVFQTDLFGITGPALFLDLDVVIVDRLEPFFEVDGEFRISHDWRWYGRLPLTGNSSCFRFQVGRHPQVFQDFCQNFEAMRRKYRNDQFYLSAAMHQLGLLQYWPERWCQSFKSHCVPRVPFRYFQAPRIPTGTRVVLFHGKPDPPEAMQAGHIGIRKYWKASPWIAKHWTVDDEINLKQAS